MPSVNLVTGKCAYLWVGVGRGGGRGAQFAFILTGKLKVGGEDGKMGSQKPVDWDELL